MDCQAAVTEFHRATLIPIGWKPSALSLDRLKLRLNLFDEYLELLEASGMATWRVDIIKVHLLAGINSIQEGNPQDIVEMADALGDIVVVAFGMAIEMGVDLNGVLAEIMRANMSKLNEDGTPLINACNDLYGCDLMHQGRGNECRDSSHFVKPDDPHGKVLKASGYRGPDIKSVLDSQLPLSMRDGGDLIGTT